jgi:excinuclease UvrABC nuclease subunit
MLAKPSGIPRQSGCYLFRNDTRHHHLRRQGPVLAQRLSSYFQRPEGLSQKTQFLMDEARRSSGSSRPTKSTR